MRVKWTVVLLLFAVAAVMVVRAQTLRLPVVIELPMVTLLTDVVDGAQGKRLIRFLSGTASFTFTNFPADSFATFYVVNSGRFTMRFPSNVFALYAMPTNQARCALLIENINGELWLTP